MKPLFSDKLPAASVWQKYDPLSIIAPQLGEWCLWSVVLSGQRNYFTGRLGTGQLGTILHIDGYLTVDVDDSFYYARVNHMIFEDDNDT